MYDLKDISLYDLFSQNELWTIYVEFGNLENKKPKVI